MKEITSHPEEFGVLVQEESQQRCTPLPILSPAK